MTSKVTAILMVFSRGDSYSLTELARLAGLPVSTAHRLAGELTARRLLERTDDGDYRIGLPLRVIGARGADHEILPDEHDGVPALLDRAVDVMADLTLATRSAVRVGLLDGGGVMEAGVAPDGPLPTGLSRSSEPVACSALGRTLLAFSPAAVVDEVLGTGQAADRVRRSLGVVRVSRFAVSTGPVRGAGAVAMPMFGAGGVLIAALELTVADLRAGMRGGRAALAVATGSLSRQLATAGRQDDQRPAGIPVSDGTSAVAYHS